MKKIKLLRRRCGLIWERLTFITQGIWSIPFKLWYANNVGFWYNYAPQRELRRLRRNFSFRSEQSSENSLAAKSLELNGYHICPSSLNRSFLQNIQNKLTDLIEQEGNFIISSTKASRILLDPIDKIPELALFLNVDICHIIAAYYGCAFYINKVHVWRNYHIPNVDQDKTEKYSNFFHHDYLPVTSLRVFVLLSDNVTRETGAFRFHDKSTSRQIIRKMGYFHRYLLTNSMRKRLINPETLNYFEGNIGDSCIVNTQECLHAASIPKLGSHRDMLEFVIYPITGPLSHGQELFEKAPDDYQVLVL